MYHLLFTCSSTDEHLCCFHFGAIMKNAAMNVVVQIFVQVPTFDTFRHMPRSGIVRSHGKSIFTFLRSCHPIFRSNCTILHASYWCTRVPVSPHICQHYFLVWGLYFVLFITDILMGVKHFFIINSLPTSLARDLGWGATPYLLASQWFGSTKMGLLTEHGLDK